MKNTMADLNNHLFAQMERLNDEDTTGDKLAEEINRAKSITGVASQIISNGNLVLDAAKLSEDRLNANAKVPKMLEGGK